MEPVLSRPIAVRALAVFALASTFAAIGATAVAALAIGRLSVRDARFKRIEVNELAIRRLVGPQQMFEALRELSPHSSI